MTHHPFRPDTALALALALAMFASGCSTLSTREAHRAERDVGQRVASYAQEQLGIPYRWGGENRAGFDCSGLVVYVYGAFHVDVPRTAHGQYRSAKRVRLDRLRPGDLLFFKLNSRTISHVAIYIGDERFVHAPRSGAVVQVSSLDSEYWRKYLVGAGRYM